MSTFRSYDIAGRSLELAFFETPKKKLPTPAKLPKAPGAGEIQIDPINLSTAETISHRAINISTRVTGNNIAYVYADILLFDEQLEQAYGPVYRSFIPAAREKEVGGVVYPDWEESIQIDLEFTPTLRILTDGENSTFGFVIPDQYTSSPSETTFWARGLITTSEVQNVRQGKMNFNSAGELQKILLSDVGIASRAPRQLKLSQGDQFTPFVQIYKKSASEGIWRKETKCLANTLTYTSQPLCLKTEELIQSDYLIGLIIQDLDSNLFSKHVQFTFS